MVPKIEAAAIPAPRVATVAAESRCSVRVTWSNGPRAGKIDIVDLSPLLFASKIFRSLRENEELFKTAHRVANGTAIAWGDDEAIDLSAVALHNLAEETLTSSDLKKFLKDFGHTETSLAATLGYSRRQIGSYVNNEAPIPRVVSLACRYIALKHPRAQRNEFKILPRIATPLAANTSSTSTAIIVRPLVPGMNNASISYSSVQHAY